MVYSRAEPYLNPDGFPDDFTHRFERLAVGHVDLVPARFCQKLQAALSLTLQFHSLKPEA
jgi:hypothetical protein